ncbi:fatty acyl-CoA reductase 1-like [Melitaea cinxia]|uniref:fatty acyl-CoA reductase 1-like n=1 Tax=Melitaea cinxia TaxID=113334 RepID=UPI001E274145|nr:fatty acyl-CoA reductase 1-like [Melitaea cinxia]
MHETVGEFYEGQSVFLTGCTGFLGKVVLEKLLYSCPGLDKVYILMREKKSMTAQERLNEILEQPLFSRLKEKNPKAIKKIEIVVGDITEPRMGLKAEDEEILVNKVSVVFHIAATVKFNEPFEVSMNVNAVGTKKMLDLSKRMKNIKVFVYVSTAYSNINVAESVEEMLYPPKASLNELEKLLEVGITEEIVEKVIGKRPNKYLLTKALAENLIADCHGEMPAVIIRPSIVTSSYVEPIAGWVDNWFGATGLVITIMKGLTCVLHTELKNFLDLIPVDYVSNTTIVAASRSYSSEDVPVYNCSTSDCNPLTMLHLRDQIFANVRKDECYNLWTPYVYHTKFKWIVIILTFLFRTVPAFLGDLYLYIRGKRTRYMKILSKAILVRDSLEYFTSNSWIIRSSKLKVLFNSLSASDKATFPCYPSDMDWDEYIKIYMNGIREFLFK